MNRTLISWWWADVTVGSRGQRSHVEFSPRADDYGLVILYQIWSERSFPRVSACPQAQGKKKTKNCQVSSSISTPRCKAPPSLNRAAKTCQCTCDARPSSSGTPEAYCLLCHCPRLTAGLWRFLQLHFVVREYSADLTGSSWGYAVRGPDSAVLWITNFNKMTYDLLWPVDSLQLLPSQVQSHFNNKSLSSRWLTRILPSFVLLVCDVTHYYNTSIWKWRNQ